jgi:hypothetical protein
MREALLSVMIVYLQLIDMEDHYVERENGNSASDV